MTSFKNYFYIWITLSKLFATSTPIDPNSPTLMSSPSTEASSCPITNSSSSPTKSGRPSTQSSPFCPVRVLPLRGAAPAIQAIGQCILPHCFHPAFHKDHLADQPAHRLGAAHHRDWHIDDAIRLHLGNVGYEDYQRYQSDQKLNH